MTEDADFLCEKCGKSVSEFDAFCISCGRALGEPKNPEAGRVGAFIDAINDAIDKVVSLVGQGVGFLLIIAIFLYFLAGGVLAVVKLVKWAWYF